MASSNSATICSFYGKPISKTVILSPFLIPFPLYKSKLCAIKTKPDGGGAIRSSREAADFSRKPVAWRPAGNDDDESEMKGGYGETRVDWEYQVWEDTMPLVGLVKLILHSGKYDIGDRLSPQHERAILEMLLPYHPKCEQKIGCGVDYITIGYHPNFPSSRCLFLVRKDGELVDFSYKKCIRGFIVKNYPVYASRLFGGRRRHSD